MTHKFTASFYVVLTIAIVGGLGLIAGCGPTTPPLETGEVVPAATLRRLTPTLRVTAIARDGFQLTWDIDRQPDDLIRGYNVYVSTDEGLSKLEPSDARLKDARYGGASYPGDTDGDTRSESIMVEGLATGVAYHVHVRTAFPNGQMSPPSGELTVVPRPRGEFVLHPRLSGGSEGYSFAQDTVVDWTSDRNDLYMFAAHDTIYLASPSRLNGVLRTTRFHDLGPSASIMDYPSFEGQGVSSERIPIRSGHSIALVLDDASIAKLRPVAIHSASDSISVTFEYMYQPVVGERQF